MHYGENSRYNFLNITLRAKLFKFIFFSLQRELLSAGVLDIYYDLFAIVRSEHANCPSEQILRQVIILHNCMNIAVIAGGKVIAASFFSQYKNLIFIQVVQRICLTSF